MTEQTDQANLEKTGNAAPKAKSLSDLEQPKPFTPGSPDPVNLEKANAQADVHKLDAGEATTEGPREHVNHPDMAQHNKDVERRNEERNRHNEEGHRKNMERIENDAKQAHENTKKGLLPEGMGREADINTPVIDPVTGHKSWSR